MRQISIPAILIAFAVGAMPAAGQQFPTGDQVMQEALLKAQAEKERNDAIVREKKELEQKRQDEERRLNAIEVAEKKGRTG